MSLASPKHRRPSWVLVGVALVALAALLGAWVFAATSDTMRVMVAARDLAPGEVIDAADLRVVELGRSGGVRAIQPDQQDLIVGRAARGPIPAGTVLNTDLFADREQVIPAGEVVVGAALAAGGGADGGAGRGRSGRRARRSRKSTGGAGRRSAEATVLTTGTVWSVEQPAAGGGVGGRVGVAAGPGAVADGGGAGGGGRAAAAVAGGGVGMIVTLASVRGSPGVTSWALLLAAAWPAAVDAERVVVEADLDGGVLGARYGLGVDPGVVSLIAALAPQRGSRGAGRGARPAGRRGAVAGARPGVGRAGPLGVGRHRGGRGGPARRRTTGCGWSTPGGCTAAR